MRTGWLWLAVGLPLLGMGACGDDAAKPSLDAGSAGEGGKGGSPAEPMRDAAAAAAGRAASDEDAQVSEDDAGAPVAHPPPAIGDEALTAEHCRPDALSFIDAIAAGAWHDIALSPADGMAGLLTQLERLGHEELDHPVRLRLSAGVYAATDVGRGEIYVKDLQRPASAPLLLQAVDPTPGATRLGQGFNLVAVSYLGFDGFTIGPDQVGAYHGTVGMCDEPGSCYHDDPKPLSAEAGIHIAGTAIDATHTALRDGHLDYSVFGRYLPSHHILVQRMTIQNVFGDDEPSGPGAAGGGSDGIKFNQAAFVWVMHNSVRQTSRHAIDNVAVHGACYLGNLLADSGQGLGIEAKGGSVDVTFDGNVLVNVRKLELGGENTDAVYYWSAEEPGSAEHYAYEGRRIIARNNIILDAREGAMEFSGCHDCAAVGNSVVFRSAFDTSYGGGDAVREVDSHINREGAGSDCTPLDSDAVDSCWNVGPYPADLVAMPGEGDAGDSRVLDNARNSLVNNLFMSAGGSWGVELNPYNHPNPTHSMGLHVVDYNYWWNADHALPDPDDGSWLAEGAHSTYTGADPNPDPQLGGSVDDLGAVEGVTFLDMVQQTLRPQAQSPLVGHASASASGASGFDNAGAVRAGTPSIGALEPGG